MSHCESAIQLPRNPVHRPSICILVQSVCCDSTTQECACECMRSAMPFIFALLAPILSPVSGSTSSPSTTCIGSVCFAGVDGCDAMCHGYTTCESCARVGVGCGWCPSLQRCLYGTDTQSTSSAPECNRAVFPAINWCACSEHVGSRPWEAFLYPCFLYSRTRLLFSSCLLPLALTSHHIIFSSVKCLPMYGPCVHANAGSPNRTGTSVLIRH